MAKHVKMVVYGEPGVGKSTFASESPRPFFICTDGNYEWLDRPEQDHVEVSSWSQMKKAFTMDFTNYDTIVVDLVEDGFKWCEQEFCTQNKLNHVSDLGYGKGYDITRTEFINEIFRLFSLNKNVVLIMHGLDVTIKDRRGVEKTKHVPTNRLPDKVIDQIEGRCRYFLRAYLKGEEQADGTILKKRYLSLIPKENEFGISRGLDESKVPQDIPLDWNVFAEVIGLNNSKLETRTVSERTREEYEKQTVEPITKEQEVKGKETAIANKDKLNMIKEKINEKAETVDASEFLKQPFLKEDVKPEEAVEDLGAESVNDKKMSAAAEILNSIVSKKKPSSKKKEVKEEMTLPKEDEQELVVEEPATEEAEVVETKEKVSEVVEEESAPVVEPQSQPAPQAETQAEKLARLRAIMLNKKK